MSTQGKRLGSEMGRVYRRVGGGVVLAVPNQPTRRVERTCLGRLAIGDVTTAGFAKSEMHRNGLDSWRCRCRRRGQPDWFCQELDESVTGVWFEGKVAVTQSEAELPRFEVRKAAVESK